MITLVREVPVLRVFGLMRSIQVMGRNAAVGSGSRHRARSIADGVWLRRFCILLAVVLGAQVPARAAQAGPVVEDLMRMQRIAEYSLSADGARAAVLLYRPKLNYQYRPGDEHAKAFDTSLVIIDARSGEQREVTVDRGQPSGLSWSPDGRKLAFQAGDDDEARIWIWSVDAAQARPLSQVRPRFLESELLWTPDSRSLVVAVIPEGSSAVDLKRRAMSISRQPLDHPLDRLIPGASVAVYRSRASVEPAVPKQRVRFLEMYGTYVSDLALVDVESAEQRIVAKGFHPVRYRLSPDGGKLVFTHLEGSVDSSPYRNVHDVYVVDLRSSSPPRLLAGPVHQATRLMDVSWSPDGKLVAFFDSGVGARDACYFYDVRTGKGTVVPKPWIKQHERGGGTYDGSGYRPPYWTRDSRAAIALAAGLARQGLWLLDPRNASARRVPTSLAGDVVQVLADAQAVAAATLDDALVVSARNPVSHDEALYLLDLGDGSHTRLLGGRNHIGELRASADLGTILYSSQAADVPEQLWLADPTSGTARRISSFNPELAEHSFGASRTVRWRDMDGNEKHGALLLPADYMPGKRYPLIVEIYGGSRLSTALNVFGFFRYRYAPPQNNRHILATRGYMVLLADTEARPGTPMFDISTSLLPGVNALIDEGLVDGTRLGILGHSYGGYSALSVVVATERFRAAVVSAGTANLLQVYSTPATSGTNPKLAWAEEGQGRMGASLWESRSKYIENSPLFYFDRIRTPVLILHGTEDPNVEIERAEEIYQALVRLGKEAELAKYFGEGHEVLGSANSMDYAYRVVEWFDRHLGTGKNVSASALE